MPSAKQTQATLAPEESDIWHPLKVIDKWIPAGFEHEPVENRLLRALLHADACVVDQRRVLQGGAPIKPLDTYPQ